MTMDEWNELTRNIITNAGDPAQLTSMLNQATEAFSEEMTNRINNDEQLNKFKEENERLRSANLDLFLKLGDQAKDKVPNGGPGQPPKPSAEERAETITIEDLFKEES